jgi:hypothetical protein
MAGKRHPPQEAHFTEEDWADFAHQQGPADQRARLERHLDSGCQRCTQTLGLWTAVAGLAGQEESYAPPDAALARAKARFALHRPPGLRERVARTAALVFDSFRQPALAGLRAAGSPSRQMLYKAGRYTIRLQVEQATDSDRLTVVGQVVDETDPQSGLPDLPVLLANNEATVDRVLTNVLGEFQLESDPSESLRLTIDVPDIGPLTLPGLLVARRARREAGGSGTVDGPGRRTRARHV